MTYSIINPVESKVPGFEIVEKTSLDIPAYGGRLEVRWEPGVKVTPYGGLAYFARYLKSTGFLDSLCDDFPLHHGSNNSCANRDIVSTAVLAILTGCNRYVQINALRNDAAAKELLGLERIVSEDTVRRALNECADEKLDAWLRRHELEVAGELVKFDYVLDIDNTVKPIYGHQEGAELGYNPAKPGRPSLNYHSFFIGGTRITLGVDVRPGSQHAGGRGMPALWRFLDPLPPSRQPRFIRADVGYGSDGIMREAEARGRPYLFKIRRSGRAKEMFGHLAEGGEWKNCGCGWQACERRLRLSTWDRERRCIFIRRPAERKDRDTGSPEPKGKTCQLVFDFMKGGGRREWDYCILVTNDERLDATALSQLYRDRGDCENNFDELKNQWGWGGFTTKRLKPCRAMARLNAIVANWWNVFTRLADPDVHREPVTSRAAYLRIVGRIVAHGGRRIIHLTSTHADGKRIRDALNLIGQFLDWLESIAEQLKPSDRWMRILKFAFRKILLPKRPLSPILLTIRT